MRGFLSFWGACVVAAGCNSVVLEERDDVVPPGDAGTASATGGGVSTTGSGGAGGATESGAGGATGTTSGSTSSGTTFAWSALDDLYGCTGHTATALDDGRVLVVGDCSTVTNTLLNAFLVDPTTGTFEAIATPSPRVGHTATRLPNGWVVIAGGVEATSGASLARSWTYRPGLGFVESSEIAAPRFTHAATSLANGRVLLTGGSLGDRDPSWWETAITASAEVVSQEGESLGAVAPMLHDRAGHASVPWAGGTLAIGGFTTTDDLDSVEWFDGSTWSEAPRLPEALREPAALTLTDGRVFVVASDGGLLLTSDGWIRTAPDGPFYWGSAVAPLEDDDVLVVSWSAYSMHCSVVRYDPMHDSWSAIVEGPIQCGGSRATATPLTDGGVLVITNAGGGLYRPI